MTVSRIERERKTTLFKASISRNVIKWKRASFSILHKFKGGGRSCCTTSTEEEEVVVVVEKEEEDDSDDSLVRLHEVERMTSPPP